MSGSGGIRFGQYVLLRRIARGGMAEVFLAQQRGLEGFDRRVAVKRILPHLSDSPDFVKMFLGEAKLAAQLTHPNIVHIYEFGKVESDYFIAMEYVDGVHAGQLFKHDEKVPHALVARIGADAAAALHYAHELRSGNGKPLNLVHRDVSPANIMVTFDGAVKLCDFGIAKAAMLSDQKTNPGQVKGKYAYMSPEQTIAAPLDGRSDVFSLSIVLWELLVGRTIVPRGDVVDAMRAIRDGKLLAIERAAPNVPPPLAKAITWGLEAKRERRASAAELAQALEAFIKSSPELATAMQLAAWVRARFVREGTGELPSLSGSVATPKTGAQPGTVVVAGTVATPGTSAAPATTIGALTPAPDLDSPLIAASRVSAPNIDEAAQTLMVGPPNMTSDPDAPTVYDTPGGSRPPVADTVIGRPGPTASVSGSLEDRPTKRRLPTPKPRVPPTPKPSIVVEGSLRPSAPQLEADTDEEPRGHVPTRIESALGADATVRDRADPTTRDSGPRHTRPDPTVKDSRPRDFARRATPTGYESTLDIRGRIPKRILVIGIFVALGLFSFAIVLVAMPRARSAAPEDAAMAATADAAVVADAVVVIPIEDPGSGGARSGAQRRGESTDAAPQEEPAAKPDANGPTTLLEIRTQPDHATIHVGDQTRTAPAQLALPAGHYTVTAELDGYRPEQREVDLPVGEHLNQEIVFSRKIVRAPPPPPPPPAAPGRLTAKTTPYSEVFANGKKLGETPFADVELAPGTYTLTFKNPNLPAVTRKVTITAGRTTKLAFSL